MNGLENPAAAGTGMIRILQIEDDSLFAFLTREMLSESEGLSFRLVWLDSLTDGIKTIEKGEIDLILLDLCLPDSPDRLETLRRILQIVHQVPVAVLTAYEDRDFARQAIEMGAWKYLVKRELTPELLAGIAREILNRGNPPWLPPRS